MSSYAVALRTVGDGPTAPPCLEPADVSVMSVAAALGLSGSAARKVARELRGHGRVTVSRAEGFLVTRANSVVNGERKRAGVWGVRSRKLAASGSA